MPERGNSKVARERRRFFLQVVHGRAQGFRVPAVEEIAVHEAFRAPVSLREAHMSEVGGVVKRLVGRGLGKSAGEVAKL